MKKICSVLIAAALCAALLAGCGSPSGSVASSEPVTSAASSEAASGDAAPAAEEPNTALLEAAVSAIEEVNPVPNPRVLDDFSVENEMFLTLDNLLAYKGDVTNDQADSALVFVAQAKEGAVDAVLAELQAYKDSLAENDMYAQYADKTAMAKDARVVAKGNYVAMVISAVHGPDYSAIDTAIDAALAG